jgi:hypothetical protein
MPKRWMALPRGIRWLAGIAVVVLALVIVWALFVPLPDWLVHHDVGSVTGALHETALDNARGLPPRREKPAVPPPAPLNLVDEFRDMGLT